jgi:hypothetical protein
VEAAVIRAAHPEEGERLREIAAAAKGGRLVPAAVIQPTSRTPLFR